MKHYNLLTEKGRNNFYASTTWRKYRIYLLSKNPLCEWCLKKDKLEPAVDVHHIIDIKHRPDLVLIESNLVCLCHKCHSEHTAKTNIWKPPTLVNKMWNI